MNRYTSVYNSIWDDDEFEALDDLGKLVYFNLLCNPAGNMAGYYRIQAKQIALYLDHPADEIQSYLSMDTGLWKYDSETKQVILPNYLKYNKVAGANSLKAIAKQVEYLEKCFMHKDFLWSVYKYCGEDALQYFDHYTLRYVEQLCKGQQDPASVVLLSVITTLL